MGERYLTGLDWSGDPGDPHRSNKGNTYLVVAGCTISLDQHGRLDEELQALRRDFGFRPEHVFRHSKSQPAHRGYFFRAISELPITVTSVCVDKRDWDTDYLKSTTGPERIRRLIEDLVLDIPRHHVSGQNLLVDMTRDEKGFVRLVRQDVTRVLKVNGRRSFRKVVARPDDRSDAAVIQVADMFAGEVRLRGGDISWLRIDRTKYRSSDG